ncbi:hypothetical protein ACFV1N_34545 [Streptosporangium canum]|uniref:restriction endonuclease subunit S n=1 Tax=Streptosporangium canum TaxID=324952 RepID=UPI0036C3A61A
MSRYPIRALGEVLDVDIDEVPVVPDETYKISGVYGFGKGLFGRSPIKGSETSYAKLHRIHPGTLVMSRLKAFEGALAVVPEEFGGWFLSPEFPTFRPREGLGDIRYVKYLCAWPDFWRKLSGESKGLGARRERVSAGRLLSVEVPLPDIDEQHRIANRLDSSLSKLEQVGNFRSQSHRLSAAIKESLIADSLRGSTFRYVVDDVIKLQRRPVDVAESEIYREIGVRSFGKGIFHKPPVAGLELDAKRVFWIKSDDLVFSNVFAWEGAVGVASQAEEGMIGSHRFMTYRAEPGVGDIRYLISYFTSSVGLEIIRRSSPGSAGRNKTLGIKSFAQQEINLPELSVQKKMSRILDGVQDSIACASKADEHAAALKTSLLNAAFNGIL